MLVLNALHKAEYQLRRICTHQPFNRFEKHKVNRLGMKSYLILFSITRRKTWKE